MGPHLNIKPGAIIDYKERAPISQNQLKIYAEASGDPNPIHLDEKVALSVGLPGVIAHGMLLAAFIAHRAEQFVHREIEQPAWKLVRFQTRFRSMTLLGDVISVGGSVKQVSETDLVIDLKAKNQKGEVVTTGVARYGLR